MDYIFKPSSRQVKSYHEGRQEAFQLVSELCEELKKDFPNNNSWKTALSCVSFYVHLLIGEEISERRCETICRKLRHQKIMEELKK